MDTCCGIIGTIVLLAVVFLVGCGSYIVAFARVQRVAVSTPVEQCSSCAYSLDGLQPGNPCPECGEAAPGVRVTTQRRLEYESTRIWMFLLCAASCVGAYFVLRGVWRLMEHWLGMRQFNGGHAIPPLLIMACLYTLYIGFGWLVVASVPLKAAVRHSTWFVITVITIAAIAPTVIHRAGGDPAEEALVVFWISASVVCLALYLRQRQKPKPIPAVADGGR